MNHARLLRFVGFAAAVAACGGEPTPPQAPTALPPAPSAPPPAPASVPVVEAPSDLAVWLHVEQPARLGTLAKELAGPPAADASCANGDLADCLTFIDTSRPVDVAGLLTDGRDDSGAIAFSVESAAAFRAHAEKGFETTEAKPGTLRLVGKKDAKKDKPVLCDIGAADASHRVVCGDEAGLARLAPWLLTSPRPASIAGVAQAEVYAGPIVAAAEKQITGDKPRDQELRHFLHDFDGATVRLSAGDAPGAPMALDFDVKMRGAQSPWTKVLLTPSASGGPVPDTFGRLSKDATAAVYLPGGGPLVALLDQLGSFASLAALDPAKVKGAADDLRDLLGRPAICAHLIDFDEAGGALARARKAPDKERAKAQAGLEAAFDSHIVCGVQEPAPATEKLARKLVDLAPKTPGEKETIRPAGNLGLPKGAFVLESTTPGTPSSSKGGGKKPAPPTKSATLVVPDGDTTWIVGGDDLQLAARLAKRILAQPKGALAGIESGPGTALTGYVTSVFGAFSWDLAMHSLDGLQATLAAPSPGLLRFALSQRPSGPGGTVSLRLAGDAATVKTLGLRAAPLTFVVVGAVALMALSDK